MFSPHEGSVRQPFHHHHYPYPSWTSTGVALVMNELAYNILIIIIDTYGDLLARSSCVYESGDQEGESQKRPTVQLLQASKTVQILLRTKFNNQSVGDR